MATDTLVRLRTDMPVSAPSTRSMKVATVCTLSMCIFGLRSSRSVQISAQSNACSIDRSAGCAVVFRSKPGGSGATEPLPPPPSPSARGAIGSCRRSRTRPISTSLIHSWRGVRVMISSLISLALPWNMASCGNATLF